MSLRDLLKNLSDDNPSQIPPYNRRLLYRGLGSLASSWLVPELAGATEAPLLANGTIPLLVVQSGTQCPLFREALLLPVRWERDAFDSCRLPAALLGLADRIFEFLRHYSAGRSETWARSLRENPWGLCAAVNVDLSEFEIDPDSAAVSLMAGLLVAASGGEPNPQIVATGLWKPGVGVEEVGGLQQKTWLAAQSDGIQMLFVPKSQQIEARQSADEICAEGSGGSLDIKSLQTTTSDPLRALSDLLTELEMPPSDDAEFTERRDHYLRLVGWNRDVAQTYYRNHLLSEIVKQCRTRVEEQMGGGPVDVLATILTENYDLAVIAAGAFRPECCLLFFTEDTKAHLGECEKQIRNISSVHCVKPIPIDADADMGSLAKDIGKFFDTEHQQQIVIDLTPGKKNMTLALYEASPPTAMLYYLRHKQWRGTVVPGSEHPDIWRQNPML